MDYLCLKRQHYSCDAYSLQPLRYEDLSAIKNWRNEQTVILRQQQQLTDDMQERYYRQTIVPQMAQAEPRQILFSYLYNEQCIGYGGLTNIDWLSRRAEISFLLATDRTLREWEQDQAVAAKLIRSSANSGWVSGKWQVVGPSGPGEWVDGQWYTGSSQRALRNVDGIDDGGQMQRHNLKASQYRYEFGLFLSFMQHIAFAEIDMNRLYTETFDLRPVHIETLEAHQFHYEGRLRQHVWKLGRFVDSVLHGCLKQYMDMSK